MRCAGVSFSHRQLYGDAVRSQVRSRLRMSAVVSTVIGLGGFQLRQSGQLYMEASRNHFASGMRGDRKARCDFNPGPLGVTTHVAHVIRLHRQ